jgi:exosome complex RNA-binding protein Rrp42 (RNase PH superfamily)
MADNSRRNRTLKSTVNEMFKAKNIYDVTDRLIERYEAPFDAKDGDPCLKTTIVYVGTTRAVDAQKEEEATWNSAWDI